MNRTKLNCYYVVLTLFIYLIISIFIYRVPILDVNDVEISADLMPILDWNSLLDNYRYLYNDHYGITNFVKLSRSFIYLLYFMSAKQVGISVMTAMELFWVISSTLAGFSMFLLVRHIVCNDETNKYAFFASFVAGIFYLMSPFVAYEPRHPTLRFGYSLLPFALFAFTKMFKENSKKYIFLSSIIWVLMSSSPRFIVWGGLLLLLSGLYSLLFLRKSSFNIIVISFSVVILYITISSYWILPYLIASSENYIGPSYTLSIDVIKLVSSHNSILNSFMFRKFLPSYPNSYYPLPPYLQDIEFLLNFFSLVFPALIFSILLFRKDKIALYFGTLTLVFIGLSTGINDNAPIIFKWIHEFLVFKIPYFSEKFGFVFRTPSKLIQFSILFFSVLLGVFVFILRGFKRIPVKRILIAIIIISIFCNSWPLITGDFNGELKPVKVPQEYSVANSFLEGIGGEDRVVWIPNYDKNYFWHDRIVRDFDIANSAQKTFWITPISGLTFYDPFFTWIGFRYVKDSFLYTVVGSGKTENLGNILASIGVKYIVLHKDSLDIPNEKFEFFLSCQKDLVERKSYGFIRIYENLQACEHTHVKNKCVWVDDFGKYLSISHVLNLGQISVISTRNPILPLFIGESIILSKTYEETYLDTNLAKIIVPYKVSIRHDPDSSWSRASTSDPLHGSWHVYLGRRGIENWQSDYGYGLVFTWATKRMPENLKVKDNDIIYSWNFDTEKEFLEWKNVTPEKQFNAIHKLEWKEGALIAKLYNSTWGWKTINSPFIPTKVGNAFRFTLKIKGENASAVHVKVMEFDSNKKCLAGKYIKGVGSGTFGWKTIQFDYIVQNQNTSYIQLQIWHGHETDKPLPNVIWVDDVKVYDITKYTKPVTLEIPFKVDKDDNYKLFIRYFKNQKGGEIKVYLNSKSIEIKTKDQLNKFVWKDLGTFYLEKGEHKIVLENVKGFNAVNLFALIPESEYNKAKEDVEKLLQNKTIIYLFEAESDLYRENAEVSKEFGGNASNGEVLKFVKDGKAWQNLEVIKEGNYRLALRGKGYFKVSIANKNFELKSNSLDFVYTPLFRIPKGKHRLEIFASKGSYLDVIWLYSTETNQTIDQLFEVREKPAEVLNYTKINPTLWKVKVNATKPFMLSFAEAYDPLWEARIYKDGKLVEKVRSIPLYSVINGFWIDKTGELEIVIRYTPQDWFEIGLIISAITFVSCIGYLFYDWRREKGDKWAKEIERRLNEIQRRWKNKV